MQKTTFKQPKCVLSLTLDGLIGISQQRTTKEITCIAIRIVVRYITVSQDTVFSLLNQHFTVWHQTSCINNAPKHVAVR